MATFPGVDEIDALVHKLTQVGWKERDSVKDALLAAAHQAATQTDLSTVREHLETAAKGLTKLELRWEIEEVLESLAPPEPEPEPAADDDDVTEEEDGGEPGKLRMSDLDMVYDDPRGLQLYRHKTQDRWFAVQADPQTGQPRMFELHPTEVTQLQAQLKGSPYWVLGAGA